MLSRNGKGQSPEIKKVESKILTHLSSHCLFHMLRWLRRLSCLIACETVLCVLINFKQKLNISVHFCITNAIFVT